MENYTEEFIEEEFRKVASGEIQYVSNQILGANSILNFAQSETNINCETTVESLQTSAATLFANSIEHGLKANIIFDDFRRHSDFRQDIGHQEWRNKIAGFVNGFEYLGRPKDIRTRIIMVNDPNDPRSTEIKTTPDYDQKYRTLNFDTGKVSGHTLDSYYQLQNSIPKMLINTEYFLYVTDEIKYTVYALLTEDILSKQDEKTIIPMDLYDGLKTNKNVFPTLRFSGISGDEIKSNDLTFLNEFSSIVLEVGKYRFSLPKIYPKIDFEKYKFENFFANNVVAFQNLDKMAKYYLQSCFTTKEIEAFVQYINNKSMDSLTLNVFINNAIYLKNFVKNRMQINLEFTEKQFARIDLVCDLLKAFQPFDSNAKRLCDNEFFATEEKKQIWIEKTKKAMVEKKREETKQNTDIDLLKEKYPYFFTSSILSIKTESEVVEFLLSEEFKQHPELFSPDVIKFSNLSRIQNILSSKEYIEHPELFVPEILLYDDIDFIREVLESKEYKEHPEFFTPEVLKIADFNIIKYMFSSDEYKKNPQLFITEALEATSLKKLKVLLQADAFKKNRYTNKEFEEMLRISYTLVPRFLTELELKLKLSNDKKTKEQFQAAIDHVVNYTKGKGSKS